MRIRPASDGPDHAACKELILAYSREFQEHLGEQDFWDEVHWLAEMYGPPDGHLLVAEPEEGSAEGVAGTRVVGCVAYERLDETTCRMKRLIVTPAARGLGIGGALCDGIEAAAREAGYQRMVLDTVPAMEAARRLYERRGFQVTQQPDWEAPCVDPVYMEKRLA